jgi:hypothetical protein
LIDGIESYFVSKEAPFSVPQFEQAASIMKALNVWAAATFNSPTFDFYADPLNIIWGIINGGVSVLPSDSLIAYCRGNATMLYP